MAQNNRPKRNRQKTNRFTVPIENKREPKGTKFEEFPARSIKLGELERNPNKYKYSKGKTLINVTNPYLKENPNLKNCKGKRSCRPIALKKGEDGNFEDVQGLYYNKQKVYIGPRGGYYILTKTSHRKKYIKKDDIHLDEIIISDKDKNFKIALPGFRNRVRALQQIVEEQENMYVEVQQNNPANNNMTNEKIDAYIEKFNDLVLYAKELIREIRKELAILKTKKWDSEKEEEKFHQMVELSTYYRKEINNYTEMFQAEMQRAWNKTNNVKSKKDNNQNPEGNVTVSTALQEYRSLLKTLSKEMEVAEKMEEAYTAEAGAAMSNEERGKVDTQWRKIFASFIQYDRLMRAEIKKILAPNFLKNVSDKKTLANTMGKMEDERLELREKAKALNKKIIDKFEATNQAVEAKKLDKKLQKNIPKEEWDKPIDTTPTPTKKSK